MPFRLNNVFHANPYFLIVVCFVLRHFNYCYYSEINFIIFIFLVHFHVGHIHHISGDFIKAKQSFEWILASKNVPNDIKALTLRQLGKKASSNCWWVMPPPVLHVYNHHYTTLHYTINTIHCCTCIFTIVYSTCVVCMHVFGNQFTHVHLKINYLVGFAKKNLCIEQQAIVLCKNWLFLESHSLSFPFLSVSLPSPFSCYLWLDYLTPFLFSSFTCRLALPHCPPHCLQRGTPSLQSHRAAQVSSQCQSRQRAGLVFLGSLLCRPRAVPGGFSCIQAICARSGRTCWYLVCHRVCLSIWL